MQPKVAILLPLALLAACAIPDLQPLGVLTPWSSIYNAARDERSVVEIAFDKAIATQIKGALVNKSRELGLKIKVYCYLRRVTLLGQLADDDFKAFALASAWEADGVRSVAAYWEPPGLADTTAADVEIAAKLRAALIADQEISATQIETVVYGGKVYLLGMVRSRQDADKAAALAGAVPGVTGVVSLLQPSGEEAP